jgi:hypothetical protein
MLVLFQVGSLELLYSLHQLNGHEASPVRVMWGLLVLHTRDPDLRASSRAHTMLIWMPLLFCLWSRLEWSFSMHSMHICTCRVTLVSEDLYGLLGKIQSSIVMQSVKCFPRMFWGSSSKMGHQLSQYFPLVQGVPCMEALWQFLLIVSLSCHWHAVEMGNIFSCLQVDRKHICWLGLELKMDSPVWADTHQSLYPFWTHRWEALHPLNIGIAFPTTNMTAASCYNVSTWGQRAWIWIPIHPSWVRGWTVT